MDLVKLSICIIHCYPLIMNKDIILANSYSTLLTGALAVLLLFKYYIVLFKLRHVDNFWAASLSPANNV